MSFATYLTAVAALLLLVLSSADRERMADANMERRREQTEQGKVLNRVVYDSQVFVPGSADRVPGGGLLFESRFESGNLRRAVHVNENEYDLLLNWDHGTRGHTQWYFFAVSAAHVGTKYTFNIVNFCKPQSLCASAPRLRAPPPAAHLRICNATCHAPTARQQGELAASLPYCERA